MYQLENMEADSNAINSFVEESPYPQSPDDNFPLTERISIHKNPTIGNSGAAYLSPRPKLQLGSLDDNSDSLQNSSDFNDKHSNVNLPRSTVKQPGAGTPVDIEAAQPEISFSSNTFPEQSSDGANHRPQPVSSSNKMIIDINRIKLSVEKDVTPNGIVKNGMGSIMKGGCSGGSGK